MLNLYSCSMQWYMPLFVLAHGLSTIICIAAVAVTDVCISCRLV